jgi:hypothetical protein
LFACGLGCASKSNPTIPTTPTVPPGQVGGGGTSGAVDGGTPAIDGAAAAPFVPSLPVPPGAPLQVGALGRLDPDEVYLTTSATDPVVAGDTRTLFLHWSQPTVAVEGVRKSYGSVVRSFVRRSDGRLLLVGYSGAANSALWFGADELVSAPFGSREFYPNPEMNDEAFVPPHDCITPGNVYLSYAGRTFTECECPSDVCRFLYDDGTIIARSGSATSRYQAVFMDGQGTLVGCSGSLGTTYACEVLTNAPPATIPNNLKLQEAQPLRFVRALAWGFIYGAGPDASVVLKVWYPPEATGQLLGTYPPAPPACSAWSTSPTATAISTTSAGTRCTGPPSGPRPP